MTIHQRIKHVRHTIGLPQTKFAKRIAISTGYIAELELGNRRVGERIIRLISMEFGIDEHWLRTGEGSMYDDEADMRLIKASSLFKMLNQRYQDFVLSQLNELIELQNSDKE
jgi:transcriptional regulator with XRE-family HTH domain